MIQANEVTKDFGRTRALDGVSITVPSGAIYGLVGPNGAGKSTLIRHIAGIYKPDRGSIFIDDEPIFDNPSAKARLFCIYDDIFHYLHASTNDLKAVLSKLYPTFDEDRFAQLQSAFQAVDPATPLRTLSRGMQKQSLFWLALSCRPATLLLDEPIDGLDPVMRRQVCSLIASDVAENGTTVLLSSHNLRELEDICDHVGVLNHGRVLLEHSLADLTGNVTKAQVLFNEDRTFEPSLTVLHHSATGRMHTYIMRGAPDVVRQQLEQADPQYLEILPLTLEEVFIYELEGADYAVQDILL